MSFTRTGVILYVRHYLECVAFYRDVLELPILFDNDDLTCFEFGGAYLMVEIDDRVPPAERSMPEPSCLRFNVPNVRQRADALLERGIAVDYQEHAWGTVAKFHDPDGNLCAFKDDATFERQVREG
jgi:lactoylglutathione lyase